MAHSNIVNRALSMVLGYLEQTYKESAINILKKEIRTIVGGHIGVVNTSPNIVSYDVVQNFLSKLNEKETIRKTNGVYYTPSDVVEYMFISSLKLMCRRETTRILQAKTLRGISKKTICFEKTVFDPTCGAGEFLLGALNLKYNLMLTFNKHPKSTEIHCVLKTIYGNDLNRDSIIITKLRLLLCVLNRFDITPIKGIGKILSKNFSCFDYITQNCKCKLKYDIVIGNPPYVEDTKSDLQLANNYGNIYANVLENAVKQLKSHGVMNFVIPLSYISTPRMEKIRNILLKCIPIQYILSFADRPDCIFSSVHQKVCILFGKNIKGMPKIFTGSYQYWYTEERQQLFNHIKVIQNKYLQNTCIPKLGNNIESNIYRKILRQQNILNDMWSPENNYPIYLNMRACFWIKAFINKHNSAEYKEFKCQSDKYAKYSMCLLNSSLFWWYWICVSDCWHITSKELKNFHVPDNVDFNKICELADNLEKKLETTKVYVGTKQTKYEYKHKDCIEEIHAIDDYVNTLYSFTKEESSYIKNFAYKYRVSGGVQK